MGSVKRSGNWPYTDIVVGPAMKLTPNDVGNRDESGAIRQRLGRIPMWISNDGG